MKPVWPAQLLSIHLAAASAAAARARTSVVCALDNHHEASVRLDTAAHHLRQAADLLHKPHHTPTSYTRPLTKIALIWWAFTAAWLLDNHIATAAVAATGALPILAARILTRTGGLLPATLRNSRHPHTPDHLTLARAETTKARRAVSRITMLIPDPDNPAVSWRRPEHQQAAQQIAAATTELDLADALLD